MAGWGWVVVVVVVAGGVAGGVAGFRLGAAGCKGKVIGFDYSYYSYPVTPLTGVETKVNALSCRMSAV